MRTEVKQRLVEALRGGAYRQVRGVLHSAEGFCVLGVLCDISGLAHWNPTTGCYAESPAYAPLEVLIWADLGEREATALVWMNDRGVDFRALAARIEAEDYEVTFDPPRGVDPHALLAAYHAAQVTDRSQGDDLDPRPPTPAVIFIVPKRRHLKPALAA